MRCFSKAERHASDDSQLNTLARLQLALLQARWKTHPGHCHFVYVAAAGVAPLAPADMAKWDAKCT